LINFKKAVLLLEDKSFFLGRSFGAEGEVMGEVVFNTCMSGYQEILTDPSYFGQIVTMTYPLIGNYGVNDEDVESAMPFAKGFIVREYKDRSSNWRSQETLDSYLKRNNIVGIDNIDTRLLTRKLRTKGALNGIISTLDLNPESLYEKLKVFPSMEGLDLVKDVTPKERYTWNLTDKWISERFKSEGDFNVAVIDYGIKWNILKILTALGCKLTVFSAFSSPEEILSIKPDGIFLSNGPGDPAAVSYAINTIKELFGKVPIFGICLGHQLMALASGAKTFKLKFGHHGGNHPVKRLDTDEVEITSQNHGFAVDYESIDKSNWEVTHINLNDKTVEGIRHKRLPMFSVQYHPEASPGPHDSGYLFKQFCEMMKNS
jgi:carbamoyl-phosphate synthase small subunit